MTVSFLMLTLLFGQAAPLDDLDRRYCLSEAGRFADIDPDLLAAIAFVESGWNNTAQSRPNTDGSRDNCAFQINDFHADRLANAGIDLDGLRQDPCACAATGATILAEMRDLTGDSWDAVAAYNAGPTRLDVGRSYRVKVRTAYETIKRLRGSDG